MMDLRELLDAAKSYQPPADTTMPTGWPPPLDLRAMAERKPMPVRHIVADWLPEGEVTLMAGHGGAGKSAITLCLGACISLGRPWYGIRTERRRVVYISAEDRADIIHWRLSRIAAYLDVQMADIGMDIIDASALDAELMIETRGEPAMTTAYDALRVHSSRPGTVLILDGASDLYGASEIVRRHVRRYIRALRRLIPADGAVLLLAHIDKAIARGREHGDHYSGSTAWNNSVRARWALRADGEGVALELEKANHARAGAQIRLRWDEQAHVYIQNEAPAEGGIVGAIRDRQERDAILAAIRECARAGIIVPSATSGRRTTYHVLNTQPSFPRALVGDSRAVHGRFWRLIEGLRQSGTLRECSIRTPARKWVGVLSVSTEETRQCANAADA